MQTLAGAFEQHCIPCVPWGQVIFTAPCKAGTTITPFFRRENGGSGREETCSAPN